MTRLACFKFLDGGSCSDLRHFQHFNWVPSYQNLHKAFKRVIYLPVFSLVAQHPGYLESQRAFEEGAAFKQ